MNLENIIIFQNKIDLIKEENAKEHYKPIKAFVQGTKAANSPIIPISAQLQYNIDCVIYYLCHLPIPKGDFISPPRFIVIRSFEINYPGEEAQNLQGGVAGGTLIRGVLRVGEIVEIRPGIVSKDPDGKEKITPIYSRIVSLKAEKNDIITFSSAYPICCEKEEKIAISRKIGHAWRLIGLGEVLSGGKTNSPEG